MKTYILLFSIISLVVNAQTKEVSTFQKKYEAAQQKIEALEKEGKVVPEMVKNGLIGIQENGLFVFNESLDSGNNLATNADLVWNANINGSTYNITGNNITVDVWDEGNIRPTHQELVGRVTLVEDTSNSNHSTIVGGVIAASGVNANAKGAAPASLIKSHNFGDSYAELAATTAVTLSNHSYGVPSSWRKYNAAPGGNNNPGLGWYFLSDYSVSSAEPNFNGNYNYLTADWDAICYAQPNHIQLKAVGNNRGDGPTGNAVTAAYRYDISGDWVAITSPIPVNDCANGFDCLPVQSAAKNIIIVGGIQPLAGNGKYTDPNMALYAGSAFGPRDDGGIKPDVVAVATGVIGPYGSGNTDYSSGSTGTSFSTPSVAGVLALWNQLYLQEEGSLMRADFAKALVCHTTNEAGSAPGPDYKYGWGLVDALQGATAIVKNEDTSYLKNETLTNAVPYEYQFTADGSVPLKATISWLDPAAIPIENSINDRTSRLINDLDLKIVKVSDNSEVLTWKLDPNNPSEAAVHGDNTVDNVEQVLIETPTADAVYKVVVTNKGNLVDDTYTNTASTAFGLVITGIKSTLNTQEIQLSSTQLAIYPNPAKDLVQIKNTSNQEIKSISLYDTTGKLVHYSSQDFAQNSTLNISTLNKGTYIAVIKTTNGKLSQKLIKN